jgi:hypothetical protein
MGGTWKRTNPGRLGHTQRMLCDHLDASSVQQISVLDIGASEGLTTLELTEGLRQRFGRDVRLTLADLNLWLDRYRKGPVVEYRARGGEPIMVKIGPLGLRLAMKRHNQEQSSDRLSAMYIRCERFRAAMQLDRRISLVNPLVSRDKTVTVIEMDCLRRVKPLEGQFNAVRASNLLNLDYFAPHEIRTALSNFHSYLVDGGCLVISRNDNDSHGQQENGTLWRKAPLHYAHVADFGRGSEIKEYVTDKPLQ